MTDETATPNPEMGSESVLRVQTYKLLGTCKLLEEEKYLKISKYENMQISTDQECPRKVRNILNIQPIGITALNSKSNHPVERLNGQLTRMISILNQHLSNNLKLYHYDFKI